VLLSSSTSYFSLRSLPLCVFALKMVRRNLPERHDEIIPLVSVQPARRKQPGVDSNNKFRAVLLRFDSVLPPEFS
jgi:hypothetical protein